MGQFFGQGRTLSLRRRGPGRTTTSGLGRSVLDKAKDRVFRAVRKRVVNSAHRKRPGITFRFRRGPAKARSVVLCVHNLGHIWRNSAPVRTEVIGHCTTSSRTVPADHPPRQCRSAPDDFHGKKIFPIDHTIRPRPLPMMSLEANRRGAFWGAAFRKFSTLGTDYLRVPAERFLHFWNRPLPIPCQRSPGSRGSRRAPSRPFDVGLDRPGNKNRDGTAR
jgi:hypothetical protein